MMKMLKLLAAAALLVSSGTVFAGGVVGSVHDLTTNSGGAFSTTGGTDRVCIFCHTPHMGTATVAPLWNRATTTTSFTMYNSAFSSTIDMTVAAQPQSVSLACLSCHDGSVAFDVLVNAQTTSSGTYNYTAGGTDRGYSFTGADTMTGRGAPTEFAANLTNQHPISVTYSNVADTAFNAAASGKVGGTLPLYGASNNQVECGSCHNPHDRTNTPFLRVSNAASAMCVTCHIK